MARVFRTATFLSVLFWGLSFALFQPGLASAQSGSSTISGRVTDVSGGALPEAKISLSSTGLFVTSDVHGNFVVNGVAAGQYKITVSYAGFEPFEGQVTVVAGQVANVNAVLKVASASQQIVVTAPRTHGEAEAINEETATPQVLDALPASIIGSLPNANIADALDRLPGVTLERDEGEGKYVQIRGTDPKLSNVTVDGVELPSPEGSVRQIKLDVIPAGLVQSVQIYKTLQPDQSGDAIGGSVNLVTKTPGKHPTASLYFGQGYTPIANGARVEEVTGTVGRRFGTENRFGALISGSYDYNGRKTYDLEPVPGTATDPSGNVVPYFSGAEVRQYEFARHRYGFGGSADYKISNTSDIYLHFLYSKFYDYGRRYDYVLATNPFGLGTNPNGAPGFNTEARLPIFLLSSLSLGGFHAMGKWQFHWNLAASPAHLFNSINGGENIVTFNPPATLATNCQYDATATTNYRYPHFTPACFNELYDPSTLTLSTDPSSQAPAYTDTRHGRAEALNLEGEASVARQYQIGSLFGTWQLGFRIRNSDTFDNSYEYDYYANPGLSIPATNFVTSQTSPNYYDGHYPFGPFISWDKVVAFVKANPNDFTVTSTAGGNAANFNLIERVAAGYLMNSLNFGRFNLMAGVRFEGTQYRALSYDNTLGCLCAKNASTYLDVLPSASLAMRLDNSSDIRFAFGKGLARPDPTTLTTVVNLDTTTSPNTYTIGNPSLKPEHAYDYDILYERTLHPLGIVRAGFFDKSITDPFVQLLSPGTGQYAGFNVLQPGNGGSAYIRGVELEFAQQFTYLPGFLGGLGLSANYSYSTSQATNVNPGYRLDNPAVIRQAPNTWNISPTYDRGRFHYRLDLSYNGPNIYAYFYTACQGGEQVSSSGACIPNANDTAPDPTPFGIKGPLGDQYLYSHFQVDMEGQVYLGKGLTALASIWNLNNEVFGEYQGSPQYFIIREIYHPTYLVGLRWDLHHE